MNDDVFESLLRRWGSILGERPPAEWGDEAPVGYLPQAAHPLSRVGAPPKLIRQRTTMDRGGVDRRRLLAQAAVGDSGIAMRVVPASYVDPVPCSETRTMRDPARDFPLPPEVDRVQSAFLALYRLNKVRALCLQARYCLRGSRPESAAWVSERAGEPVGVNRYGNELMFAKVWVHARIAA